MISPCASVTTPLQCCPSILFLPCSIGPPLSSVGIWATTVIVRACIWSQIGVVRRAALLEHAVNDREDVRGRCIDVGRE